MYNETMYIHACIAKTEVKDFIYMYDVKTVRQYISNSTN